MQIFARKAERFILMVRGAAKKNKNEEQIEERLLMQLILDGLSTIVILAQLVINFWTLFFQQQPQAALKAVDNPYMTKGDGFS